MNKLNFLRNKRFRHGSFSFVFTVVVIALVVVLNVIVSAFYQKYHPTLDMTNNDLYTISDTTRELLSDVTAPVNIIFCADPDVLDGSEGARYVHQSALEYQANFDFVTVEYRNVFTDPTSMDAYKTSEGTTINNQTVVVESGTEYRLFSLESFYLFSESTGEIYAYDGEMKFTSAILQLTASDMPIAYLTNTHGETVEEGDSLWTTLENAGYDVKTIDLSTEEISPDARLIVINDPTYDFSGRSDTGNEDNEIQHLDDFLSDIGSLIVFRDPVSTTLPNLDEYLEEWGIKFEKGTIYDPAHSIGLSLGALNLSGYGTVAEYPTEGTGAALVQSIRELQSPPKTVVPLASPITMLDIMDSSKNIYPVLTTYAGANLSAGGDLVETDQQYNLMTVSSYKRTKDDTEYYSYVLACGSKYYNYFLDSSTYANQDVLYGAFRGMGKENVPADIDYKLISSQALDITESEQTIWTVGIIFTLPIVAAVVGVVIYVRRRNS